MMMMNVVGQGMWVTPDQQLEAIEAKRQDPLEEVSYMTKAGRVVCEMEC